MTQIKFESIGFFREVCRVAQLKPKIDETQAFGVLSALLATISTKQTLSGICDYFEIFDFMVDNLIAEMGNKMNISQIIVKIYEGLLQFVPFFRVIWIGTVLLGFAMLIIAFVLKKNPVRKKSPWIVGGIWFTHGD